jgi:hypothetical protein
MGLAGGVYDGASVESLPCRDRIPARWKCKETTWRMTAAAQTQSLPDQRCPRRVRSSSDPSRGPWNFQFGSFSTDRRSPRQLRDPSDRYPLEKKPAQRLGFGLVYGSIAPACAPAASGSAYAGNTALDAVVAEITDNLRFHHGVSRKAKLRTFANLTDRFLDSPVSSSCWRQSRLG